MTKILVIDDEIMLREAIVLGLRAENFEVFEAEDGITGMQLARSVHPDLIVSDINMKSMDGYDTLAALRTDKATANIPFVLMTGRADLPQSGPSHLIDGSLAGRVVVNHIPTLELVNVATSHRSGRAVSQRAGPVLNSLDSL